MLFLNSRGIFITGKKIKTVKRIKYLSQDCNGAAAMESLGKCTGLYLYLLKAFYDEIDGFF
jgi:hypothetical protein